MVDFGKRLGNSNPKKKINPVEIYDVLDRKNDAGPLRNTQLHILEEWFANYKNKKDLIVKLHTGEGKTLIGLLILLSRLNESNKPCLYICPDNNLVNQTCNEAIKFGIPYCVIGEDRLLPNDFLDGKRILITNVNKLFNGKSKFGLQNKYVEVDSIVLDDSHACIDSIKNSFTITIPNDHELYTKIRNLFENEIKDQGEGSYLEILDGKLDTLLPIPYWAWNEKRSEVLEHLSSHKEDDELQFVWPLLKDKIENCQIYISGQHLEISPYFTPIHQFGTFDKANHRILMSATTQDDSFFIKGLGFQIDAVLNPLTNPNQKWSGEKMIIIPSLMDDDLDRVTMVNKIAKMKSNEYGIAVLCPSYRVAEHYETHGSIIAKKNISEVIEKLKTGEFSSPVILVNRYDGIDLPDEACRILVFDSLPYFRMLSDQYEESCRLQSDVINIKYAQKIEQGLGRAVRGEKDYCVILLLGSDLINFVKGSKTNRFFSAQTQQQVQIGLDIVDFAKEELESGENSIKILNNLIKQSLSRDEKWKEYYANKMNDVEQIKDDKKTFYDALTQERAAEYSCYMGDYDKACDQMQSLIDKYHHHPTEKGWFLQSFARYKNYLSKVESNKLQKSAYENNFQLLKPREGINYKRLNFINENRAKRVHNFITQYSSYDDLMLSVDSILSDLSFGVQADKFEAALQQIGLLLGYLSQRPDKEFKKGSDNLWCGVEGRFIFFECKSSVDDDRQEISKHEAGQMNNHCGWFDKEYGTEVRVNRILIVPTKTLSYNADFTHKVVIMRKGKLKSFKDNVRKFVRELKSYNIKEIGDEKIQEFLIAHDLQVEDFTEKYTEAYYHKGH